MRYDRSYTYHEVGPDGHFRRLQGIDPQAIGVWRLQEGDEDIDIGPRVEPAERLERTTQAFLR